MQHPGMRIPLMIAAALFAAGCSTRQITYTYTKEKVSEAQLLQDERELRSTSGVQHVVIRHDALDNATLELYLDADNRDRGVQKAVDLGFQRVRN
jgi:hypothetical protein